MRRMCRPSIIPIAILAVLCTMSLAISPLAVSAQSTTSSLLVKLAVGLSPAQQAQVIARNGGVEVSSIPALRLHVIEVATADLAQVLANYQADPQVVSAEENKTRQSQAFPADPLYQNQWALPKISWDLVFGNVTPTGSAVVAVLDTGVDAQHPDLAANVMPGISILDGSSGTTDPSGHGTWVAGIVAAQTDTLEGIAGVAYAGVRIMPVTVLDANGIGQDSDIIAGVIWAADHGADVIVMAFSSPGFSQNLQDAIDYAWSKNVILVAATGNNGLDTPTFPAGDRGVMGVSGTDPSDALAPFSSYGPSVFIAAPATDIPTTAIGDAYAVINGTSASAAIVAGAAAFMKAVDPALTNGIIVGRLARMADPAGTQDQTGNGRINMARALADTGTAFIQPAGAPPTGNGGPFVGPYVAAARNFNPTFQGTGGGSLAISVNVGVINIQSNPPCSGTGSGTASVTITTTCSLQFTDNAAIGTLTSTPNGTSVFAGWSPTLGTCSGTTNPCSTGTLGGGQNTLNVTFSLKPTTTSILPTSKVVGEAAFTMTVTGTNFQTGAVVRFNGSNRTTSGTGTTTRAASILASDLTTAGTFSITVANPDGGVSNAQTFTVNKANTTTNITSDTPDPSVVGQAYIVSWSVTVNAPGSGTPTGTVTVTDGTGGSCSAAVTAGSCALTSASSGAKSLTATYAGDSNFAGSTSATAPHQVNKADTTTTINSDSPDPSVIGQAYTVSVTVAAAPPGSGTPTGSVNVTDGSASCSIATLSGGTGSCLLTSTTAGAKTLTATYGGDSNFNNSSGTAAHQVDKGSTTTTITSDAPDPSAIGQAYTVSVSVAPVPPAVGTPSGSVTITDGTGGTCTIGSLSAGTGSCAVTSTTAGAKTLTATYAGDASFNGSTGTEPHTVSKGNTTTTITSDAPDPSAVGQAYTVNVSVAPVSPAVGTPSGSVNVTDGTGGSCAIASLSGGTGSCSLTSSTPGAKTLTATYAGDTNFNGSSGTAAHQVDKGNTTTTITGDAPDPSVVGQAYSVSVSVAPVSPAIGIPSGSVTITDGAGGSCTIASLSGGTGSCSVTSTTAGAKTLTATYGGDANFNGSGGTEAHTVNKANTTTTISGDAPDPSVVGEPYTVNVSVAAAPPGTGTPSGSVSVTDGAGATCTIASLSVGTGSCSLTSTTAGAKTLTATFSGDANFNGSTGTDSHQVDKANTTTTIISDTPDPSAVGQGYTVSVSVVAAPPGSGTASGSVTVTDGSGGSCTVVSLGGGTGSCVLTSTSAGAKTLTATYAGDSNFNGSTSAGESHQVQKADTTTTITSDLSAATKTGEAYTVSFTVTVNSPGAGTPTGNVTVSDGTDSCIGTVVAGSCALTSTTPGFPKTITATYAGDSNFNGSTSAGVAHVVDTPPTATADRYVMVKGNTLVVYAPGVLGDDGDADGQAITVAPVSQVSVPTATTSGNGTLNYLNADGSFSYTPNPGFVGTDSFSYEAYDGTFASSAVTVYITVVDGTTTPVAENDAYSTTTNVALVVSAADGVFANDRHVVGHSLATVVDLNPAHGTLVLNADGSFTYTPDSGFTGTDSFTYHVHDSTAPAADSNIALVTIAVRAAGATPTANNDSYTTDQGVPLTISASTGVLSNDSPGVTAALVSGPVYGGIALNPDGSFTYTPGADFSNRDSFIYRVTTGTGAVSNLARVTIRVREQTTTSVSSSANPSVWGQSVSFTATVSPTTATGTVQFKIDGVDFGSPVTLVNGTATSGSTSSLSVGSHPVTVIYGGDDEFVGSTGSLSQTANKADTTTTITGDTPDPSKVGQAYTVSFTVTANPPGAGTPTGTVMVTDGTGGTCSASVATGSCTLTSMTAGAKTLTAVYAGDSNFNGSTSAGEPHQVDKADTTTAITSDSPDPSNVGQPYSVTFSVSVTPPGAGTPTGTVTVSDGTGGTCSASVAAGSCSLTSTTAGSKTLTAVYGGDGNFNGSTSAGEPHQVDKADTTTAITSDTPDPSKVGQPYTVTFSVSVTPPGAGTPTGMVTVSDGTGATCSASVAIGSCPLTSTTAGAKTLTAAYAGDSNFNGSTSAGEPHQVDKANTTTAITSDSPDPSKVGQAYAVTFSVSVTPPGAGTPTGTVTVSDGTGGTCSASVAAGSCSLTSTMAGSKTLTAVYGGDGNFNGSTSAGEPHQVDKADTTTTITNDMPDPSKVGQAYTVSFTVTVNSPGAGTPTGNVTVSDGAASCTATVAAGGCSLTSTTAGSKTLTAAYAGDSNFNGGTSTAEPHQVQKADTTTAITGHTPTSSVVGQAYTVSFNVTVNSPGAGTPTGNVTVSDGAVSCTATVAVGSCSLTSTTAGNKTLTATYAGDSNFNNSSGMTAHQVNKANTTTTITSDMPDPSVTGQAYTVSVTVAAVVPGAGLPSSSVTINDGLGGTCTITALSSGAGSCTLASTTAGAKALVATYGGDANFNGSTSASEPHTVNKANTATTIGTVTPEPSVVGQAYTVNVTVTAVAPGTGTPSGSVTVSDGTGGACTIASLSGGAGSCALTSTSSGAKTLTASYTGDSNFNGSSGTKGHQVNPAATTTTIGTVTPEPSLLAQPYTVNFTVTVNAPGAGTPTGTVTVSDGTGNTCSATLATGSCTLPSLTAGPKTLTASYQGDTNFAASSGTKTHNIVYTFIGYLQPVDNPPIINTGNPGRTYPIKWQLKDANGNYVGDLGSFKSLQYTVVTCGGFDLGLSSPLDTGATGGTVLRYDATANQFIYNWQTPNTSNACYVLTLTLKDGTTHLADFQMKK